MSTYHLHARLLVGPIQAPLRDEARVSGADTLAEAQQWSRERVAEGFTVWIYDHGHVATVPGASDLRRIAFTRPSTPYATITHPAGCRHTASDACTERARERGHRATARRGGG